MAAGPETDASRIVVGVDGSGSSQQALRWAAHFAATFAARLEVLSCWEYPPSYGWAAAAPDWNPGPGHGAGARRHRTCRLRRPAAAGHAAPCSGRRRGQGPPRRKRRRGHACRRQPRPWRVHRAPARLGQRKCRRALLLPGVHRAWRPGTASGQPRLSHSSPGNWLLAPQAARFERQKDVGETPEQSDHGPANWSSTVSNLRQRPCQRSALAQSI
jgi:hypothetical protein